MINDVEQTITMTYQYEHDVDRYLLRLRHLAIERGWPVRVDRGVVDQIQLRLCFDTSMTDERWRECCQEVTNQLAQLTSESHITR